MRTHPRILIAAASFGLIATQVQASGLRGCDAKHKRPANLYGSVLSEGLKPATTAESGAGPAKPPSSAADRPRSSTSTKPRRVSRADLRDSFAPCLGDRT